MQLKDRQASTYKTILWVRRQIDWNFVKMFWRRQYSVRGNFGRMGVEESSSTTHECIKENTMLINEGKPTPFRLVKFMNSFSAFYFDTSGMCYIGISTGRVPVSQLSASSYHSTCPFSDVKLNSGGGWCAATSKFSMKLWETFQFWAGMWKWLFSQPFSLPLLLPQAKNEKTTIDLGWVNLFAKEVI